MAESSAIPTDLKEIDDELLGESHVVLRLTMKGRNFREWYLEAEMRERQENLSIAHEKVENIGLIRVKTGIESVFSYQKMINASRDDFHEKTDDSRSLNAKL